MSQILFQDFIISHLVCVDGAGGKVWHHMKLCLALSDVEDTAETNCQLRPGLGQGLSHTSYKVLLTYQYVK